MRITTYYTHRVLRNTLTAQLILLLVYVCVDFVEMASAMPLLTSIRLYPLRLPLIVGYTLPLALTLGCQFTLAMADRYGELNALASAGVSNARFCAVVIIVPILAVLLSGVIQSHLSPMATAAYAAERRGNVPSGSEKTHWCKHENALLSSGPLRATRVRIERNSEGAAEFFEGYSRNGRSVTWTRNAGWRASAKSDESDPCATSYPALFNPDGMMPSGSALTVFQLIDAIHTAESRGWTKTPLEAEAGLRLALVLSCLAVPLLGLGWSQGGRGWSVTRYMAVGLSAAALYWLVLAVTWNGAAVDLWSSVWVSAVPLGFLVWGGGRFAIR